jgi:tripartite-type tricarboxylate transporter receptor subunit TctC
MAAPARLIVGVWLALAAALSVAAAQPDDYPNRPVRLIVGFPPGSSADITARLVGGHMTRTLGQQVVVENRPGAGSSLAAEYVARAPKDGYTLFLGSSANITNQAILTSVAFDMAKDFSPIARATTAAVILVVHPAINVKSLQELITLAKSKPGEVLYASTGVGTAPHLSGELLAQRAGVKIVHVPYQGSPQAATDLLAGRVHMMFSPASAVMSHVESGRLRALASAAARRPGIAPNVPTMEEAGIADFDTSIWFGLMAPAGTPRPAIDKLTRALNEAVKSDEIVSKLRAQGFEPLGGTPDELGRYVVSEIEKWGAAAQAAGLKK